MGKNHNEQEATPEEKLPDRSLYGFFNSALGREIEDVKDNWKKISKEVYREEYKSMKKVAPIINTFLHPDRDTVAKHAGELYGKAVMSAFKKYLTVTTGADPEEYMDENALNALAQMKELHTQFGILAARTIWDFGEKYIKPMTPGQKKQEPSVKEKLESIKNENRQEQNLNKNEDMAEQGPKL